MTILSISLRVYKSAAQVAVTYVLPVPAGPRIKTCLLDLIARISLSWFSVLGRIPEVGLEEAPL